MLPAITESAGIISADPSKSKLLVETHQSPIDQAHSLLHHRRRFSQHAKLMSQISPETIYLRPATSDDEAFLFELYRDTRTEEMATWGWEAPQQQAFLSLQFRARNTSYSAYPNPEHSIILNADRPIGRLLISRMESEIRLVDVALLHEARGFGIGAKLVADLFALAASEGKPLRLHVEKFNRALQLYQRLGFQTLEDTGTQFFMEWRG